jgi:PAS domain S-box-containing protein
MSVDNSPSASALIQAVAQTVLVVDDDAISRHILVQTLASAGLNAVAVGDGDAALSWLAQNEPAIILLDLVMPGTDGYSILHHVRAHPKLAPVPIVVLTALDSDEEIQRVFLEGADDYVHKPFRPTELVARIRGQLQLRESLDRLSRRERNAQTVVELTQTLASSLEIRTILHTVVARLAQLVRVERCSIVLVGDDKNVGHVVATSDDEHLRDLTISLQNYPEIMHVLRTGETLVIRGAPNHPLLLSILDQVAHLSFHSLALVPILHENNPHGVIFMRAHGEASFGDDELALVRTVANATSIALRNARVLQSLRDETRMIATARVEAEHRVQLFQRYADFFESAADGMMVVDRTGSVLFANPRAREITGYSEAELMTRQLSSLCDAAEGARVQRLLRGFRDGLYPRGVDLSIRRRDLERVTLSVSFSSVLHDDDAIVLGFRDVTVERRTAIELKQTKEFLERMIDSSVDAIVSADLQGTVLLFNRAASRMFQYDPTAVVGKMPAAKLYPEGQARWVLRRLVDPRYGNWGQLESYRVQVVSSQGEVIPASLSAAFIEENGKPIGTVGIYTDLRERLRMEQRLQAVQDELRNRERQSILAELAGAAAHELNQPLTSIIGYSELLCRQLPNQGNLAQAASVIINQAERMAEIVRRIGKITKYETMSYVGEATILDLEKASR